MLFSPVPPSRGGDAEFVPLLFPLTPVEGLPQTPRTAPTRAESSVSTQRRSVTPPGSVHTGDTPSHALPPPILRLTDDILMEDVSTSRGARSGGTPNQPAPFFLASATAASNATPSTAIAAPTSSYEPQSQPQHEDVWVTVYGFGAHDMPAVLSELSKCGDILKWVFGTPTSANFMHVQFQNKWAAQRALQRNGQLLSNALMIGVKVPEPAHRRALAESEGISADASAGGGGAVAVSGLASSLDGFGSGIQAVRLKHQPDRPYLVDPAGQPGVQMPQPSRSTLARVVEFVLGY